jgi:hypothetical protein
LVLEDNPDIAIYIQGSTPARTRLYRMAISRNFELLNRDFTIYGIFESIMFDYVDNMEYEAFLVTKKFGIWTLLNL